MTAWRRDIHKYPELGFEERRTADFVARKLAEFGLEVHTGIAETGVVGVLRAGVSERKIALRADMDALPIVETNSFDHRSQHDGVMHACGHDGHTTMLLGAARYMAESKNFDGTVYFIFQPAEEGQGGARRMIEEGLFERFPAEEVYGMHNFPGLPVGQFALRAGPMMAAVDTFDITITGRGGHAALPNLSVDPLPVAAQIVSGLQSIVARRLNPVHAGVVSVTKIHGGEAYNVIPDQVSLGGCTRSFLPEVRDAIEDGIRRITAGLCAAHGAQGEVAYQLSYPAVVNSPRETGLAAAAARAVVGEANVDVEIAPVMGSEDFAFMLEQKPGAYIIIGNGPGEGGCLLHNPGYDFNDEILTLGARYWATLAESRLSK